MLTGESIPVIKALQDSLISLQRQFPKPERFPSTTLDGIPLQDDTPISGLNPATTFITNYINNAFKKLVKYYSLTDASIWYTVGIVLNPSVKFKYLKYQWKNEP